MKVLMTFTFTILLISAVAPAQAETPPERVPDDVLKALGLDGLVADTAEAAPAPQSETPAEIEKAIPIDKSREAVPETPPAESPLPERLTASLTMSRPPELAIPTPALTTTEDIEVVLERLLNQAKGGVVAATHVATDTNVLLWFGRNHNIRAVAARAIAAISLEELQRTLERRLSEVETAYLRSIRQLNASARRFETAQHDLAAAQIDAEKQRRAAAQAADRVKQLTADFQSAAQQLRTADMASKQAAKELARFNKQSAAALVTPLTEADR